MKHRYILIFLTVMLGICSFLFISFYDQAKQEAIKNTNNEQLLYARQAARGIEDFFNNWTHTLTALSEESSVINLDARGKQDIELLYRANQDRIRAITRVDATGTIIYTFPFNRSSIGKNISYQEHVREIMHTQKPVVSNVFNAVQGYDTVALHVPVFRNKTYQGTIAITIDVQALAKRYLEDIKIRNTGYAWMISRDGTELYCPVPGHTGKSVFENCKDFPSILVMARNMLKGHQGLTTYAFDKIRGTEVENVKKHAVYMPINIGNTFWSIVVASSEDEIIESLEAFRNKLIAVIIFLMLSGVLFAYFGLKAWFIIGEEKKRQRTEQALRVSEEKYRKAFHTNHDAISITRLEDGMYISINEGFTKYTGYTEPDITGKTSFEINIWENSADRKRLIEALKRDGKVDNLEAKFRKKNGSIVYGQMSASVIDLDDMPHIFTATRDITDHKQAVDALRESEEKFRRITENISDIVCEIDAHATFKYISPSYQRILGYIPRALIGDSIFDLVHPEDRDRVLTVFRECVRTAKDQTVEFRYQRADGNYVWLRSSGHSYSGVPDEFIGGIINSSDITGRKKMEESLRESEEKYRGILESIKEGYFELDLAGNFTFVNDAECKHFGYSRDELIGMNYRQYTEEVTAKKGYEILSKLYRTGEPIKDFNWECIRKDGTKWVSEFAASLIRDKEGKPIGFRGLSRDITERKRSEDEKRSLEERLQRAEKMEALGTLAGGVAHDLNNVLGVVIGYTELLQMEVDKSSPVRPRLKNIIEGGQRAAAIVQDLLTLARRGVTGRTVLNLNKIIADCRQSPEIERLQLYYTNVEIKTDLDPDLLNISGSSVHLEKSLYNLVSNACEAMTKGGSVTIKTANHYLDKPIHGYDQIREGDYVVLTVSDMGEGISGADLKRIFEPFYTKKVMGRSGTGLGLAVVWGTVKDHNGYINVQSEEGKGSIFTLYFPVTREDVTAEAVPIAISEYMGTGETVLIVDDVKQQRELAADMLLKLHYNVTTASSGEEAVAYLQGHTIDLIVLDMIMEPGMDGLDTYKAILESHPKQKAIIVSGFSESDQVHAAQALGAGAYVRKPYVIEKLGLAVRKELDGKQMAAS